ncbi:Gfo/Idh/MocA family protein [Ereboglobus luteus]|uniref:Oxidoreductase n=1 Tax=Ereboglobus luteus TaxID=1796921 RepID=A0A2U8E367_9BACT|nr:Gfo/Idh/MocA family oxidoreductase [Ereboglobus luteus]AWI09328.1 oxidoreductase [Ereboglobus luteus]
MRKTSSRKKPVRIAIIGAGGMGNTHADCFRKIPGCELVAAVDVDAGRAAEFCAAHGIPHSFGRVDEMLAGVDVDAVSIVTPDVFHAAQSIQCLAAGKHVLCEKPLATDYREASAMVSAARKAGTVNMVNFSYRNWSCIQAVAALVRKGGVGEIRHVEASYLQAWLVSKAWGDWRTSPKWLWRLSGRHGSKGALGDIGVHIVDFATYPAGPIKRVHCKLGTFGKAPKNRVGEYKLDANDSAVMTVEFASGALGTIHTTRWMGGHANRLFLKIAGTRGTVEIDSEKTTEGYRICAGGDLDTATWRDVAVKPTPTNYERFITSIRTGRREQPDFARGAEIQRVLDACFESDARGMPVAVCSKRAARR